MLKAPKPLLSNLQRVEGTTNPGGNNGGAEACGRLPIMAESILSQAESSRFDDRDIE